MSISLAQRPHYLTLSVEEYNEIAETNGDPVIDTNMIGVVPGQPSTYPRSATDLQGAKNVVPYGTAVTTTAGSSVITQSITKSTSEELSTEHTHNIDIKGGAGAVGLVVGGSYGHGWGSGTSTSNTSSVSRSGSVANIPSGYSDYGFTWEFATWDTTIGSGSKAYQVPVLGYLVSDVRQPPSVPQNLNAMPDTREVELSWDHGFNSAAEYEICYYLPDDPSGMIYYPIATVGGSQNTFTDTGLKPGTAYRYVMRAIGADGKVSNYTEPVMVVTASDQGGLPKILVQPQDTNVRVGANATFSITALPAGSRQLRYTWQSRSADERVWKNIENSDASKLELRNVTTDMNGTQYRCMVSELDSSAQIVFVYSATAALTVGKASSTTTLSLSASSGTVAYNAENTTTASYEVPKYVTIGGTAYSEYTNTYEGALKANSDVYYGQVGETEEYAYYLKAGTDAAPALGMKLSALDDLLLGADGTIAARRLMERINNADGTFSEEYSVSETVEVPATAPDGKPTYHTYNAYTLVSDSTVVYEKDVAYYTKSGDNFEKITDAAYISTLGLYGVENLDANRVSSLVQIGPTVMTTELRPVTTYEAKAGDPVTLTAKVEADATSGALVTFQFTNTTTGGTTSEGPLSMPQGTNQADLVWTPTTAGVYQIVAVYSGSDDTLSSISVPVAYYAQETPHTESGYSIGLEDALLYGEEAAPTLKRWTKAGNTISTEPILSASFTAYRYDSGAYAESGTHLPSTTLVPGQYRVDAVAGDAVVASKLLTVGKCPVIITAPQLESISASGEFDPADYEREITYSGGEEYSDLFTLTGPTDVSKGGNYDIQVTYKDGVSKTEFLSRYIPTFVKSVLSVEVGTYIATYSAGSNGMLKAYDLSAGSKSFASGAAIPQGHGLLFEAEPNSGFQVSKWTVTVDGQPAQESDYRMDGNVLTLNALIGALNVQVEFTNQFYDVTFGVKGSGGKLTAEQNGTALTTIPARVASGSSITFTALPDEGQVVKEWTVGGEVVKENDSVFSGTTLPLKEISADTIIFVSFEDTASYAVTYSAVDSSGNPVAGVTMTADHLTNGQAVKGSAVTLTASCTPGIAIREWQIQQEGGTWKTVAPAQSSYTIQNLQQTTEIRVVVSVAQTHNLTWNIAMLDDTPVPDGIAELIAASNGQPIMEGPQSAYIPVPLNDCCLK